MYDNNKKMDLHPNEIRVLKVLDEKSTIEDIAKVAGLDVDAVNRTVSWLSTKDLVRVEQKVRVEITLDIEGKVYVKEGLPERRIISILEGGGNFSVLEEKLKKKEISIGLGWLRKKNLVKMGKNGKIEVLSTKKTADEELLLLLSEKNMLEVSELTDDQLKGFEFLKSRKRVIKVSEKKMVWILPTQEGKRIGETTEVDDAISQLTSKIIKTGEWKNKSFRPYDIRVFVKPGYPAKKHPLRGLIDKISNIFVAMGFTEINGPLIESAFWNFDAVFVPQDHPARDMHDTFYLEKPIDMKVSGINEFGEVIKETHENGGATGSTGWGYKWDKDLAKSLLLRTHTTSVTCRHLTTLNKTDLPAKVFCVGKVFRNEAVDYKHLPEFYQVEGIVVDENANFRNLLGILDRFYQKMGLRVRFRPAYFPYTEMSVEPEVYIEGRGWIELGGAGIFRPEVVKPLLGFDCPVLAWGLGLDRVVALSLGMEDIRELYISDLNWLRKSKMQ